jgi:hypothetical protein
VQIARVDHWFKNAFMMLGTLLALFYQPSCSPGPACRRSRWRSWRRA